MLRNLIVLSLILLTDFSFGQVVMTQTHTDATIGLDRKAFIGLGNTSQSSDGYAHDFTLPVSTNPCQQITGITVEISLTNYTNNNTCPHPTLYYNLFYGCTTYAGGATCLNATNLIAEPNYAPNTSPPTFNFGSPLGSPINPNIIPDFGDNLSVDIIPVSNPGCNTVSNGYIAYEYTITVTVTVTNIPSTPPTPTFTPVAPICSGDAISLPTTSLEGISGTWSPALDNTTTTTYTFTPAASECALTKDLTISVTPKPADDITNVTICSGETYNWTANGVDYTTDQNGLTIINDGCTADQVLNLTITNQPAQPIISCYETASFNALICSWEVTGSQPIAPTGLECWETVTFNNLTCVWEISGTQPIAPSGLECWETAMFNNTTCVWEISGTQPIAPSGLECWETVTFNNTTCVWEITGTQPTQPIGLDCWETVTFNNTTCVWEITGTQPTAPSGLECWETAAFNNTTCVWEVIGTQPTAPSGLECWEVATFNNTTCVWEISGTQPTQPSGLECWESATFNNTTCVWEITGTQPIAPSGLECWETAMFNNTTCVWEISGTQPIAPSGL